MASDELDRRLETALGRIRPVGVEGDLRSAGLVRDLQVSDDGTVRIEVRVPAGESPALLETVRQVVSGVRGVGSVHVTRAEDAAPPAENAPDVGPRRRVLPVVGPPASSPEGAVPTGARAPAPPNPASRSPADAVPLPGVSHVVAVSSGKGGVGKTTVSANLAAAWAAAGHRVGLLDADIYGPDIPTMFGVHEKPRMHGDQVVPLEAHGVKLMSLGFLVDDETPAIWRGPIIMGVVRQFLNQVEWGELDYLVVDLPPGTGDAQLSLVQLVKVAGAVMVTTPQDVAVGGVLRGIRMFETVDVPIVGLVENMRGFACPECGAAHDIFGAGGGERLAAALDLPFLGAVPLGMAVREEGDGGVPAVTGRPDSAEGEAFVAIARAVEARLAALEVAAAGS